MPTGEFLEFEREAPPASDPLERGVNWALGGDEEPDEGVYFAEDSVDEAIELWWFGAIVVESVESSIYDAGMVDSEMHPRTSSVDTTISL